MLKRLLPLVILMTLALAACGAPAPVSSGRLPVCGTAGSFQTSLGGIPYTRLDPASCAIAIAPYDAALWLETPYNSRKIRGRATAELACKPITPAAAECADCGIVGQSTSALLNFDPSVFPDDAEVKRVILAVHSPVDVNKLADVQLRGRLNVGDELQSLGQPREIVTRGKKSNGWVLFDITLFGARAINERRNSINFELSVPCQNPPDNLATVSILGNEARLIVEYN